MAVRIFHHYLQLPLVLIALAEAAVSFGAYWASVLLFGSGSNSIKPDWIVGMIFAIVLFIAFAAVGLYNSRQRLESSGVIARTVIGGGIGTCFLASAAWVIPFLSDAPRILLIAGGISIVGSTALRLAFARVVDEKLFKRKVLVFGAGKRAASIAQLRRRSDQRGFSIAGYVRADGDADGNMPQLGQAGDDKSLWDYCEEFDVDEIVVAMDDRRRRFPMEQLLECRLHGIEVLELVTFLERETGKVRLDILNPSWMIFSTGFRRGRINSILERAFDIAASLLLLTAASPFIVLTIVAIKLGDGLKATVFYSQTRVGQYGHDFNLLKFRSMREDAERDGKAQWATKNDVRVTKIGAFIRKTRIDELPQILNVLRGEMSFVGPRPERPVFVSKLNDTIPYYRERHAIKPGITGWAQLCYPYGSSEQDAVEKLQYDLYYVKNHSLVFYLAILLQTVEVILWRKGAR